MCIRDSSYIVPFGLEDGLLKAMKSATEWITGFYDDDKSVDYYLPDTSMYHQYMQRLAHSTEHRDYGLDGLPSTNDMGEGNDMHDSFDTNGDGVPDVSEPCEPFSDVGEDGEDGTLDEGERNGKWDGYSMIYCDPVVLTDRDGYARIQAVFPRELCIWQSTDYETGICTFEDFTASISSTLLIPQITTSDPLDIQLVRTQTTVGCP